MDFNRVKKAYAYQIERQLVQTKGRILVAFRTLEEEIVNLGEITYLHQKESVAISELMAITKSEFLRCIKELPLKTLDVLGDDDHD